MKQKASVKTDDVFRLIHSMSANEKRVFKLSPRQAGEKKYLKAFDMIAAQQEYNEAELKAAVSNYGVIKNQLIGLIVKSLRNMPSTGQSPEVALKNEVVEIKIMANRGLREKAMKRLHAAKRRAVEYQRYPELLELLYVELQLFKPGKKPGEATEWITQTRTASKDALNKLDGLFAALLTDAEFNIHLIKMKLARNAEEYAPFQKFKDDPLIVNPEKASTFEAKVVYSLIKSSLYYVSGEREKSLEHNFKLIDEAGRNPRLIVEIPGRYSALLHNGMMSAVLANDEKRVRQIAALMRNLPVNSLQTRNLSVFASYIFEHSFYKQRLDFKKAEQLLVELENLIREKDIRFDLERRQVLLMYKGDFYFFKGDWEKASESFGQIIFNKEFDGIRLENGAIARTLYLLAQFEKKEIMYMRSLIQPFKKFLKKADYFHATESIVFDFLSKWNPANSNGEKKKVYEHYLAEIENAMKNPGDNTLATHYFDFVPWFRSKLTNENLAKLMAEGKRR